MSAVLDVDGVVKKLGGQSVLRGVALQCGAGEITALFGVNGAGKSTLLQIIAGVLVPDRGAVRLCGASIIGRHVRGRRQLGYVPEAADPPRHLTVNELLALTASLKQTPALAASVRARIGVEAIATKQLGQLSLGERRRACLAAALVGAPALLVLDEPTNGLDAGAIDVLAEVLRERANSGGAVLLATHDRDFARGLGATERQLEAGEIR